MLLDSLQMAFTVQLLPFLVAIIAYIIAMIPRYGSTIAKSMCVLTSYICLLLILGLTYTVLENGPVASSITFAHTPLGAISLSVYIDCLALIPTFLSALFASLAQTFAIKYLSLENRYKPVSPTFNRTYAFMLIFLGAMTGACFSGNMIMIIIFWEISSLCSYVLVAFWHEDPTCRAAALKTLIITHIGTVCFLIGAITIYPVVSTWEIHEWTQRIYATPAVTITMILLFIGILPKAVQFPLHTWLPDATVAPTPVTAYVHVVGFLMGLYAFPRFFGQIFTPPIHSSIMLPPQLAVFFGNISIWNLIISLVGAITLILAPIFGLLESETKRLIAYCLISALGGAVMVLGFGTPLGIAAGLFDMIPHVFFCGLLFFASGVAIYRIGSTSMNDMGGLHNYMPITTICGGIGALSWLGFPFLGYFTALWLIIHAALELKATFFIVSVFLGSVLKSIVILRMFHAIFLGKSRDYRRELREAPVLMLFPMVLLSILLFIVGIFPQSVFNLIVLPALHQLGLEAKLTSALGDLVTASGSWNPTLVTASILTYSCIVVTVIFILSKSGVARGSYVKREEMLKPFLCGEDVNLLEHISSYHLYHVLTNLVKINNICNALNVDHIYYTLSRSFSKFCVKMLHLDIKQQYFPAVISFMAGAAVVILIAVLMG
ncbi:MAG: proton-conducting transporter membrane subunit [Candidatus Bathyarchaeia archaeon]